VIHQVRAKKNVKYYQTIKLSWFWEDVYSHFKPKDPSLKVDKYTVICSFCKAEISVKSGGITALNRHTERPKCIVIRSSLTTNRIVQSSFVSDAAKEIQRAAILLAATIASQDLAMNKADAIVNNFRHIFRDSMLAKDFKIDRTKATAIIKHVLNVCVGEELVQDLQKHKFSL
jgi:hypothetical protein